METKKPDETENSDGRIELPDVLFKCKKCTYRYPLQQTPQKDGQLFCPHCDEAFELDEETLADLETGY